MKEEIERGSKKVKKVVKKRERETDDYVEREKEV